MKNYIKFFGIIALAAVIGFSFTACGDSDPGPGGSDIVPSALVGQWIDAGADEDADGLYPATVFEIHSTGIITPNSGGNCRIMESSSTLGNDAGTIKVSELYYTSTETGSFDYIITDGIMTISNQSGVFSYIVGPYGDRQEFKKRP